jgi:hypothetical protein
MRSFFWGPAAERQNLIAEYGAREGLQIADPRHVALLFPSMLAAITQDMEDRPDPALSDKLVDILLSGKAGWYPENTVPRI